MGLSKHGVVSVWGWGTAALGLGNLLTQRSLLDSFRRAVNITAGPASEV